MKSNQTTSSTLTIEATPSAPIQSVSWRRISKGFDQLIQKQQKTPNNCFQYPCSVLDRGCTLQAHIQMANKQSQIRVFGPISFDPDIVQRFNQASQSFPYFKVNVSACNKIISWKGNLRVVKSEAKQASLHLYICQSFYTMRLSISEEWCQNRKTFSTSESELSIKFRLDERDHKIKNILGNQTSEIIITCESRQKRDLLICLCLVQNMKKTLEGEEKEQKNTQKKEQNPQVDFENLFSEPTTPELGRQVIEQIEEVIYTPAAVNFTSFQARVKTFQDFQNLFNDNGVQEQKQKKKEDTKQKFESSVTFSPSFLKKKAPSFIVQNEGKKEKELLQRSQQKTFLKAGNKFGKHERHSTQSNLNDSYLLSQHKFSFSKQKRKPFQSEQRLKKQINISSSKSKTKKFVQSARKINFNNINTNFRKSKTFNLQKTTETTLDQIF